MVDSLLIMMMIHSVSKKKKRFIELKKYSQSNSSSVSTTSELFLSRRRLSRCITIEVSTRTNKNFMSTNRNWRQNE